MAWNPKGHIKRAMTSRGLGVGERTRTFLTGLRSMLPVAMVTRLLTGIAGIVVARMLGPSNFGLINLALATALWIQVPLFIGMPISLMHYIPGAAEDQKRQWMSIGLVLLLLSVSLTLLAGAVFAPTWSLLQKVPVRTFQGGLVWCAGFAIFSASTSLAIAWEQFHRRAMLDIVFTVLYIGLMAVFISLKRLAPMTYLLSLSLAYAAAGVAGLFPYLGRVSLAADQASRKMAGTMLTYGLTAGLGNVVNALLYSAGRLVANRYLGIYEVGILSAYQTGTLHISVFLVTVISQAFFPLASRTPDKFVLLKKINRVLISLFVPLLVVLLAGVYLYFKILGKRYPFSWSNAILYAVAASLALGFSILDWFLASRGRKGVLLCSLVGLTAGLVNWVACLYCIPRWKVAGAGAASVVAAGVGILLFEIAALCTTRERPSSRTDDPAV